MTAWKGRDVAPSVSEMTDRAEPTRLFLVTPPDAEAASLAPLLEAALAGNDVAAVLIARPGSGRFEALAAALVPIAQAAGAAAIVADDTRLAGHVKADGVHVSSGLQDLRLAVESFRPRRIVGAGDFLSRHAAMEAGELDVDYVFFGRPDGDTHDAPHPKALDLAEWWSEVMQVPAVVMAGRALDGVADAAATGAAFVALCRAVWSHPAGPAEAVRAANALLADRGRRAA
jgi:thiamine-phosphate pyrophosphorylase